MESDPSNPPDPGPGRRIFSRISGFVWKHGTFYRLHLTAFTLIPLVFAGIFYASNGQYRISFLDSLFMCYSAMTVTGSVEFVTRYYQFIYDHCLAAGNTVSLNAHWGHHRRLLGLSAHRWYFQNVCEYVDYQRRTSRLRKTMVRSRSAVKQNISAPVAVFKQADEVPARMEARDAEKAESDRGHDDDAGDRAVSDARTFTSSPRPATILLPPVDSPGTYHSSSPPTGVGFGYSTSVQPHMVRLETIREGVVFPRRTATIYSAHHAVAPENRKFQGSGGFPGPVTVMRRLFKRGAPTAFRKFERTVTLPYTSTLEAKKVPWLSFDGLVVGRNSAFRTETLNDDQLESIGGVEYRALRLLSYLIPCYFVGTQLFSFLLFAPWLSVTHGYDSVFTNQYRPVKKPWFSLFLVLAAYSGGGLSLVDLGMLPFQSAYLMIFALSFVILAGNHALVSHIVRFNMHVNLILFLTVIMRSLRLVIVIEWISFEALDHGLDFYKQMGTGAKVVDGLFQGLAARASGFSIRVLNLRIDQIFVYPVAMTIRSTNVYETESLGIFEEPPDDADEEPMDLDKLQPRERIGRYLWWHIDRQLSIDIWWMVWGVFLVAIIERDNLLDENKKWFDLFRILFELVSAFGGIGLSLGFPSVCSRYQNDFLKADLFDRIGQLFGADDLVFSAGCPLMMYVVCSFPERAALSPSSSSWSSCAVRGRHRGLPVGIERAVTLPRELNTDRTNAPDQDANTNGATAAEPVAA
ncbi:unnamed protein product [Mycena citricolor]|uniref:Uncharacterized protein n=1 Tax=Mycena citricolor TaxID=2018698 RepID=A0AAD2HA31_9AGAR|nr:unnamed protein product [Mycena citricolor]